MASHENGLLYPTTRDSLSTFHWRQHPSTARLEIDDIADARENVRLMRLHCALQIIEKRGDTVNVGDGQDFESLLRHEKMFAKNMRLISPEQNSKAILESLPL